MYAQEMKLPEGKKCAAFIGVYLRKPLPEAACSRVLLPLSLDNESGRDAENPVLGQYGMTDMVFQKEKRLLGLLDEAI